jgi:hypothetical protein
MNVHILEKVSEIDKKTHVAFLITCNQKGLAQADGVMSLESLSDEDLKIKGWFSSALVSNLENNPNVTLIVWNIQDHQGYQLKGRCMKKDQLAFLDGFVPKKESAAPQVEWELMIHIDAEAGLCRQM